jgi:hypothetical protein
VYCGERLAFTHDGVSARRHPLPAAGCFVEDKMSTLLFISLLFNFGLFLSILALAWIADNIQARLHKANHRIAQLEMELISTGKRAAPGCNVSTALPFQFNPVVVCNLSTRNPSTPKDDSPLSSSVKG